MAHVMLQLQLSRNRQAYQMERRERTDWRVMAIPVPVSVRHTIKGRRNDTSATSTQKCCEKWGNMTFLRAHTDYFPGGTTKIYTQSYLNAGPKIPA